MKGRSVSVTFETPLADAFMPSFATLDLVGAPDPFDSHIQTRGGTWLGGYLYDSLGHRIQMLFEVLATEPDTVIRKAPTPLLADEQLLPTKIGGTPDIIWMLGWRGDRSDIPICHIDPVTFELQRVHDFGLTYVYWGSDVAGDLDRLWISEALGEEPVLGSGALHKIDAHTFYIIDTLQLERRIYAITGTIDVLWSVDTSGAVGDVYMLSERDPDSMETIRSIRFAGPGTARPDEIIQHIGGGVDYLYVLTFRSGTVAFPHHLYVLDPYDCAISRHFTWNMGPVPYSIAGI